MGGDDLGDDDDYLNFSVREDIDNGEDEDHVREKGGISSSSAAALVEASSSDDDDDNNPAHPTTTGKRSRGDDNGVESEATNSKKKKKTNNSNNKEALLLETSRQLLQRSKDEQALFLSTALKHYLGMSNAKKEQPEQPEYSTTQLTHGLVQPKQDPSFLQRLLSVASKKRLKKHGRNNPRNQNKNHHATTTTSPHILIICQSARRAVAILKECAPLGVKAAKLFPKQASVAQQAQDLRATTNYALAVGTPHRLLALMTTESNDKSGDDPPPLDLTRTQWVVLDAQPCPPKEYTVCTLPDTAPSCMELLQRTVLPQVVKRKDIKLVFL